MAQEIKIAVKYLQHIVWALVLEGIAAIAVGVLILLYPPLLILLASLFFIVSGILAFVAAYKVNKYTVFKFRI
jgi:uncharacterized membrane protein HdeD (DUF308 family)